MKCSFIVVNFPVSLSIESNLYNMIAVLNYARHGDIIIFPEGALSGYSENMIFLQHVDEVKLEASLVKLGQIAIEKRIEIWIGSITKENGKWFNSAIGFLDNGEKLIYRKINLANAERGHFEAGNQLPIYPTPRGMKLGIQLCRELRFPEQWAALNRKGADIFVHMNNAIGDERIYDIWRSHLISRAAENQRFVISVNSADIAQKCPTIVIAPNGNVLLEIKSDSLQFSRIEIDLTTSSNQLIQQCRSDLVSYDLK